MELIISKDSKGIPQQTFNGKTYKLFPSYKYFQGNKSTIKIHRDVWEYYNGPIPKGMEVHHKNENKHDNRIENLELKSHNDHARLHSKKRADTDPRFITNFQKAGISVAPEWHRSEEGKQWHSERGKENWKNAVVKECTCLYCGKGYTTKVFRGTKYCSHRCNVYASRKNVAARKRLTMVKS